ncbi:RND family transporter [Mycolicibacterium sp.]|uniref:MMPL/RND family transporter n=1 Tax=Mycolicibacterium sp. TaxID=2320850 RepID=UPI001E13842C|nr:RND family transporter [Mycolicibacterium sp.]MCB1292168.1 RND family transporter [Mycobacterium sp.]MCB9408153.1 RND family transporter [Mycolicibacterium sp.]
MSRHPAEMAESAGGQGVFGWIGHAVTRRPLLVIGAWIALAILLAQIFPSLAVLAQKAPASILPPNAASVVSQKEMADAFKEASSDNILLVVLTNENGFTKADEDVYRKLVSKLRAETEDVAALQDFVSTPPLREILVSKDNKAWLLPVNIVGEVATPKAIAATKRAIQTVRDTVAGTSLEAFTTGPAGTFNDIQDIGDRDVFVIETATIVALLLILLMVYRNPLTMILPLITIGVSLATAQGVVAGLGTLGLSVSNQTIVLLTAMLAGAGTDYAVFLISRYHDYIRNGDDPDSAVRNALNSVGKVITASAATVAVTFMGMIFTKLTVFYTVGIALAAAIAVGCAGALTFLPSLLTLAGRRGWAKPRKDLTSRFWKRSGIRIVRRPVANLLASLVILVILASTAGLATYNYDDRKALPPSSDSIQGYDAITRHFPLNASLPQYILITSPHDLRTPQALADMEQMAYRVSQVPDIDIVRGITRPTGESLQQARLSFQAGEVGKPLNQTSSLINGNAANLDMLVFGADQIADVLGAVRGQLGQTVATVGYLVQSLAFLQNQYGTGKSLPGFDPGSNPLNTIHGLGGSMGVNTQDAIEAYDTSIAPVLKALDGNPVCDADPECVAARGRLQLLAEAREDGTLNQIADLCQALQEVPTDPAAAQQAPEDPTALPAERPTTPPSTSTETTPPPTQGSESIPGKEKPEPVTRLPGTRPPGTHAAESAPPGMGLALDSIGQSLEAAGINDPADLAAQLNLLQQGIDMLAVASRQVANGVNLLVDQTKRLGVGLEQASLFLLSMKNNATTPSMAGFYIPAQILTGSEFRKAAAIFISADGRTARYLVQTKLNPFSPEAMDQVNDVLDTARGAQPNTTLADASISMTGLTVTLRDTRDYYYRDLKLIITTTVLVVFGILVLLLRALVAPLYLIVSVVISYLSALGMGVALFELLLDQELHWSVPGLTFIILVAVGADYNLLLISRIRDESPYGIRSGVIRTVTQTGGVITAAGLIFAASMIGLQFSSIGTLVQIGFIIAAGILLDTFLVRTITVPATAVLVGKANWWPSKWQPPAPTRTPRQPEPSTEVEPQ